MKFLTLSSITVAACAAAAGALVWPPAVRSQIIAAPSWIPIGVSQSGGTSTAWFHEPSSRQVLACQTVGTGAGAGIQCASARLP